MLWGGGRPRRAASARPRRRVGGGVGSACCGGRGRVRDGGHGPGRRARDAVPFVRVGAGPTRRALPPARRLQAPQVRPAPLGLGRPEAVRSRARAAAALRPGPECFQGLGALSDPPESLRDCDDPRGPEAAAAVAWGAGFHLPRSARYGGWGGRRKMSVLSSGGQAHLFLFSLIFGEGSPPRFFLRCGFSQLPPHPRSGD